MPGVALLVAVGAMSTLRPDDYAISSYREHGHCLAKGADVDGMDKLARLVVPRDREARNQIVQLAHVARKWIVAQRRERVGREAQPGRHNAQETGGEQQAVAIGRICPALAFVQC